MTKYTFTYDVCTPDYFQGYNGNVVQVPVYSQTTYGSLKTDLLDWTNYDHIEDLDEVAYKALIEDMFFNISDLDKVCDFTRYIEDTEDDDEYIETVYFFLCFKVDLD